MRRAAPSMRVPPRRSASASAPAAVSGASSAPSSRSMAPSSSASGTVPARVRRTHQPRPSWRVVVTMPTQRRSMAASQASTCALVVSSGKRSSTSATWTPAQSSTGAHHSRVSQSKRRCGMLRTLATICGS